MRWERGWNLFDLAHVWQLSVTGSTPYVAWTVPR